MDKLVIVGGRRLQGRVAVSGAKNAVLPIMAAALMAEGTTTLQGVPRLADVDTLGSVLQELGVETAWGEGDRLDLRVCDEGRYQAPYDLVRRMRASFCVLGPLLARRGRASVSLPGGCNLGHRPIELHLKGLQALGAEIRIRHGYVEAEAKRLRGANVFLGGAFGSTVTGTCNVLSAAVLAEGRTVIESAACEPEVVDLGRYLIAMGARIEGLGTPRIEIEGVTALRAATHAVIPDRIEAATLMIAGGIAGDDVVIDRVPLECLTAVVEKLAEVGVEVERLSEGAAVSRGPGPVSVRVRRRRVAPRSTDVSALPYPGFPTDVQAQMTALLCLSEGISVVTDKVFPDRFMHIAELARLGARVRREGPSAIISGVGQLSGAYVMASDLRASAALVLAGLAAEGVTTVRRIYHLDRGYDGLDRKLRGLNADVRRLPDEPQASDTPSTLRGPTWMRDRAAAPADA